MTLLRFAILAAFLALISLAAANWSTFSTPTRLSLLVSEIEAPLGLLLLSATAVITALLFLYVASLRTSLLIESRRIARELDEQRALASQAESSRLTQLQTVLEQGIKALGERIEGSTTRVVERADALEQVAQSRLEESTNILAAHMGQVDDKLARALGREGSGRA